MLDASFQDLPEWVSVWVKHSIPLATLGISFLSGLFPIVNIELFLILVAALVPSQSALILTAVMAGVGQVASKALLYLVAYRFLDIPFLKKRVSQKQFQHWQNKINGWGWKLPLFLSSSAFFGFPPFMIVSFVLGVLRIHFWVFVTTGLIGRTLRFGLLLAAPQYFLKLLHS